MLRNGAKSKRIQEYFFWPTNYFHLTNGEKIQIQNEWLLFRFKIIKCFSTNFQFFHPSIDWSIERKCWKVEWIFKKWNFFPFSISSSFSSSPSHNIFFHFILIIFNATTKLWWRLNFYYFHFSFDYSIIPQTYTWTTTIYDFDHRYFCVMSAAIINISFEPMRNKNIFRNVLCCWLIENGKMFDYGILKFKF